MAADEIPGATAVVFPFDLFGSPGAGAGAMLLADELREILADNRREKVSTRALAYTHHLRLREFTFETLEDYQTWRPRGRQAVRQALRKGDFLLWLAGNHLGVLPLYDELSRADDATLVIQLDAHLDIHHFTDCTSELSHGNFLRHCESPLPPLVNIGHRDLLLRPDDISPFYRETISAERLATDPKALARLQQRRRTARRVFLDLDCDVLDTAYFPAVSRPVPFGITPQQLLAILDAIWGDGLAGVAISEFDPGRDQNDRSLSLLVWFLEFLLLRRFEE